MTDTHADLPKGLTYCSDEHVGFSRRRTGKAFRYLDSKDAPITDEAVIARIRALGIPPAWTDVWICPRASGHIQATGRDAAGRKQYRYHEGWSTHASQSKFERLAAFARALPKLRSRVEADLNKRSLCREKVLATTVRLLELSLIRVGNVEYARQNRSFGLTTLTKRHFDLTGAKLSFHFRGKSGKDHEVSLRDRRLAGVLRSLQDLPGQQLFKYRNADGDLCSVTSDDVNGYIRDAIGEEFSAKDFRTWAATVSAARALKDTEPPETATQAKGRINLAVKAVAGLLGNTPTVCRKSYIHPAVPALFEAGKLHAALPGSETKGFETALIRALEAAR